MPVDDILMNQAQNQPAQVPVAPSETSAPEQEHEPLQQEPVQDTRSPETVPSVEESPAATAGEETTDEYGNPIPKKRLFTEEEVQKMIRDRLRRGNHETMQPQQPSPQNYHPQQQQQFQPDMDSEQGWEEQLEAFNERWYQKRVQQEQARVQQHRESIALQQFEAKFHMGMSKYADFVETVADKPIDNDMILATRGMENPAAFLYAAAKTQPAELARIAQIDDKMTKAVEIGRLHEKMKKLKSTTSSPRPIATVTGDVPDIRQKDYSIEDKISQDAMRHRRG